MAGQEPSKVLGEQVRALAEDYEAKLGEAFTDIAEGFQARIESLIERYGQTAVGDRMKRYPISMPGGTLFAILRPLVSAGDIVEETWAVDEEV